VQHAGGERTEPEWDIYTYQILRGIKNGKYSFYAIIIIIIIMM